MPLTQPTATFASQRQKQNYYPSQIPFRSQREQQKSCINIILENDDENELIDT